MSLSKVCRWLAQEAERLGVMILWTMPLQMLFMMIRTICGRESWRYGAISGWFEGAELSSVSIYAKHTLLAEGCRGSVTESVIKHTICVNTARCKRMRLKLKRYGACIRCIRKV